MFLRRFSVAVGGGRGAFLAALVSIFFSACSGLKLDIEKNCLNDKAACFKADKTRPQLVQSVFPAPNALVSQLPYVDLLFSEELNNPQPSDFSMLDAGAAGLSVVRVEKIANYTYRLTMNQSAVSNGPIRVSFANLKDYAGNLISGVSDVIYQGNVDIAIRLTSAPAVLTGISNKAGGYNNPSLNVAFTHGFVDDDGNAWSACVTQGEISCPIGTGFSNGSNLASADKIVSPGTPQALSRLPTNFTVGQNRLVIYVENLNKNRKGINSWPIFRTDGLADPYANTTFSPPADAYASAQLLTITCQNNPERIIYTVATQSGSAPVPPVDPAFDAAGQPVAPAQIYTGALRTPAPVSPSITPQYTTYKWLCIDRGGNKETTLQSARTASYTIDPSIPAVTVNLDSSYRDFISPTGYASTTLRFTTNLAAPAQYKIVHNAASCTDGAATVLQGLTPLPVTAGDVVQKTLSAVTDLTSDGVYKIRICVQNVALQWGFAYLEVTRDSTPPATLVSPAGGSYGAQQNVSLTCDNNAAKVAYTTDGSTPSFFANGEINVGLLSTGPITTPEGVTTIKYLCRDKAGNEESIVGSQTYTVDSVLPTITVVSNTYSALSTTGAQTSTQIAWTSSRPSSAYTVRLGGTSCTTGTQIASGTTGATISTQTVTTVPVATLGASDGTFTIRICAQNLIGNYGSTTLTLVRDTVAPTFAGLTTMNPGTAGQFTLNWNTATDASGSGIARYNIYRATAAAGPYTTVQHVATAPAGSITVTVPDPLQSYYFVAGAVDNAGNETKVTLAVLATKPTLRLVVSGLGAGKSLTFADGTGATQTVLTNIPAPGTVFATTLALGQTYNLNVSVQPAGQVCAIREKQFGTLSADLTANVDCTDGYLVAGHFQVPQAQPIRIMLYKGFLTIRASGQSNPNSLAVQGSYIYYGNFLDCDGATAGNQYCIYRVGTTTGTPATFVSSLNGTVRAIAGDGSNIYFATLSPDNRLYKVPAGSATPVELAQGLSDVHGIAVDGNFLYLANRAAKEIRRFDITSGSTATVVSGLSGEPLSLALVGSDIYFTMYGEHGIYRVAKTGGSVSVPYGSPGVAGAADNNGTLALFSQPHDITYDGAQNLYVAEYGGSRIRRINLSTTRVTTLAGDGTNTSFSAGTGAAAKIPYAVGITSDGRNLYFSTHNPANNILSLGDRNLVGHWPLNGQPTDYASAAFSGNFDAAATGTFTYPNGRFNEANGAYRFDGSNYLTIPDQSQYDFSSEFTLSAWIYRTASGSMRIIDKITVGQCDGYNLDIAPNDHLRLLYCFTNSVGQFVESGAPIPTGQWVHVAATSSAIKQRARLYINGRLEAEKNIGSGTTLTNALSVRIGADHDAIPANRFSGAIAEVRMYGRSLNEGEINELAQDAGSSLVGASFSKGATELLSQYSFDSLSSNDYGALGWSVTNSSAAPVDGKEGDYPGAVGLDGTAGSYLYNTAAAGLPAGSAPRTLCAFVKPTAQPAAGVRYPIISYGSTSTVLKGAELTYFNQAGTDYRIALTKIGDSVDAQVKLPLNSWSHICGTNDGSTSRIFLNGGELALTGSNAQVFDTTPGELRIGKRVYNTEVYNFRGHIDEVRIYNKALSTNEIRQLAANVAAGLIHWYDLEGDTNDMSGNGLDMTNNGASLTDDRFGFNSRAYKFNGTSSSMNMGGIKLASSDVSFAVWVNPSAVTPFTGIFDNYNGTSGAGGTGGGLIFDGSGNLAFFSRGGVDQDCVTNLQLPMGIYTHIAATQSTSPLNISVYVNGSLYKSCTPSATPSIFNNGQDLRLGKSVWANLFNGLLDDARVYNRALTAKEVAALAQQPNKRIFITNSMPTGNMGGIAGADGICAADGANPGGGKYKAMLVDGVNRRACSSSNCSLLGLVENIDWVFRPQVTYVQASGILPVFTANTSGTFAFGTFTNPITTGLDNAWTGLATSWVVAASGSDFDCNNWTGGGSGAYGQINLQTSGALFSSNDLCSGSKRLYCVEQ